MLAKTSVFTNAGLVAAAAAAPRTSVRGFISSSATPTSSISTSSSYHLSSRAASVGPRMARSVLRTNTAPSQRFPVRAFSTPPGSGSRQPPPPPSQPLHPRSLVMEASVVASSNAPPNSAATSSPSSNNSRRRAALTLTPAAVARLKELYAASPPATASLLKVGTVKKGCSGQTYKLEYVPANTDNDGGGGGRRRLLMDEVVEQDGVRVVIDARALLSLVGSEMDYVEDALSSKFVFNNPNVKEHSLIAKDPFADIGDEVDVEVQGYIHIRIQQRNGRKTLTTVQGLPAEIDPKKVLKAFKKEFACNGNIIEDEEHGECIQLQGDQRAKVLQFLTEQEISTKDKIKLHGF
ncbi:Eukaryotic translation initiation factor eIF-1 [Entophlyctis sp. JEL0112]|nr:Eukaryotic translation initiation factor eIF-1 [Entophlyctis sp. JEL0112]